MAIRPTDLQNALIFQTQAPPVAQRAAEAPVNAQAAVQAQFIAKTDERNERLAEAGDAQGNKIELRDQARDQGGGKGRKRERKPGDPFDEVVADASGSDGVAHLIDYSA